MVSRQEAFMGSEKDNPAICQESCHSSHPAKNDISQRCHVTRIAKVESGFDQDRGGSTNT